MSLYFNNLCEIKFVGNIVLLNYVSNLQQYYFQFLQSCFGDDFWNQARLLPNPGHHASPWCGGKHRHHLQVMS